MALHDERGHGLARSSIGACLALLAACTPEGGSVVSRADAEPATAVYAEAAPSYQQVAPQELSDQLGDSRNTAIVRAANDVAPAVVSVNVIRTESVQPRSAWESYFLPPNAQRQSAGFGSGVIVDPSGIIVTNDHGADHVLLPDSLTPATRQK